MLQMLSNPAHVHMWLNRGHMLPFIGNAF